MDDPAVLASPLQRPASPRVGNAPGPIEAGIEAGGDGWSAQRRIEITVVMPTVFWCGTFERCARRILALVDRAAASTEVVFAFDGPAPAAPAWLDHPAVRIVATGRRSGPAVARNLAARAARGQLLLFVDADVELGEGAIDLVCSAFQRNGDLVGVFGAYDDEPMADGVVSVFRNLLHHHTHVSHAGRVGTFWSGCGALRTSTFLDIGGFDEVYAHPSVEDIELGMRIAANGGRIMLLPELSCKHLKRWTLASMVVTDVVHRARPWTRLIMNSRELPASLNLDWRSRVSGVSAMLLAACLAVATVASLAAPSPVASLAAAATLVCGLVLIWINLDFYRLCAKKRGLAFAASATALHWLYFVYSSLTFAMVATWEVVTRWRRGAAGHAGRPAADAPRVGEPHRPTGGLPLSQGTR